MLVSTGGNASHQTSTLVIQGMATGDIHKGNILKYNGKLYKAYRGSASYAVQQKRGKNPYYIEGDETIVEYKGGVQNILDQIDAGLRSSMSYMAANNLEQLKKNGHYVVKQNIN